MNKIVKSFTAVEYMTDDGKWHKTLTPVATHISPVDVLKDYDAQVLAGFLKTNVVDIVLEMINKAKYDLQGASK